MPLHVRFTPLLLVVRDGVRAFVLVSAAGLFLPAERAEAQAASPVTIDDSPWAWELIQRARDQAATNPTEAARLLESVLEEHPTRLVPWPADASGIETGDRFRNARAAANEQLLAHPALLERWRTVAGAAARRRLDAGDLAATVRHGLLTEAGLVSALRLAQSDVESGRFAAALRRLAEVRDHPDRRVGVAGRGGGRRADAERAGVHALILEGLACAGLGDVDGAEAAMGSLEHLGDDVARAGAATIRRLLDDRAPLPRERSITPFDVAEPLPAPSEPPGPWHLLASLPLPDSLGSRASAASEDLVRLGAGSVAQLVERGSLLAAAPSVVGGSVLVNEGTIVRSFDRLGGRLRWQRELVTTPVRAESAQPLDLSVVVADGDALVSLVGYGTASARIGGERVACLDAATGDIRWLTSLGALGGADGGYEGFFPVGAPVLVDGTVCVFARKVTGRLETVTYVVGLSLADGSIRWARHHSSAAGIRLGGHRPMTTLLERDGILYAAASTGAMAAIDAEDGDMLWLRRQPVPIREPRYEAEPWELGGALPTAESVVVLEPDQMAVTILDRDDGSTISRRPVGLSEPWGLPRYFLRVPEDEARMLPERIVAVGSDIAVFDSRDLVNPLWRFSQRLDPSAHDGDDRLGVRGRVQVAGRELVIPMRDRVLVADVETGRLRTLLDHVPAGVVLLAGQQLLSASTDRLLVSMPFDSAERILRQRLDERRDDPDRALSLLALAVRAGSLGLCLEAGEAALQALATSERLRPAGADREELVSLLLRAHDRGVARTTDEADALHAVLAKAAQTPRQRALQILARADHLARSGRRAEAISSWQAILSDSTLASVLVADEVDAGDELVERGESPPALRSAEVAVLQRMSGRRAADSELAAAVESAAAAAMAGLEVAANPADAAVLAMRFPGTAAGGAVVEAAVGALIDSGRAGLATRIASRALNREIVGGGADAPGTLRVLDILVRSASRQGAPARGLAAIESLEQRLGPDAPDTLGEGAASRSVSAARRELVTAGAAATPDRPRLAALSGEAREISGRLLRGFAAAGMAQPAMPVDSLLCYRDGAVRQLDDRLAERWSLRLDDPDPRVLRFDANGVLLWSVTSGDPVVAFLDPQDGRLRWTTRRLSEMLPGGPAMIVGDVTLAGGATFDPAEVLPLLAGDRLALVRRSGDVATIGVRAGPEPAWTRRGVLTRVYAAWSDDATILLGGVDGGGRVSVVALDAWDGAELVRWRPGGGEADSGDVRWILGTPEGTALVGMEGGVEAVDVDGAAIAKSFGIPLGAAIGDAPGESTRGAAEPTVLWRTAVPLARGTSRAWSAGGSLLVADALEGLTAFDRDDAARQPRRFDAAAEFDGTARLREVMVEEGRVVALFQERVAEFDHEGSTVGRDAAADARDYRFMVPGAERLFVVSAASSDQVETPIGRRTQYTYRIYVLDRSQGCKLEGTPRQIPILGQKVERVAAIDGWLLLSTASSITAVPLAGQ